MATKRSVNGKNLEYIIIRPVSGFNADQIADGLLLSYSSEDIKAKFTTWNKLVSKFKDSLLDHGWNGLDYAWERIYDYDQVHPKVVQYIKSINKEID